MFPTQIELMVQEEARRQVHLAELEPLAQPSRWSVRPRRTRRALPSR